MTQDRESVSQKALACRTVRVAVPPVATSSASFFARRLLLEVGAGVGYVFGVEAMTGAFIGLEVALQTCIHTLRFNRLKHDPKICAQHFPP